MTRRFNKWHHVIREHSTRWRRIVVMAALVVVVACCTVGTTEASCGDYLYRNGRPVTGHSLMNSESEMSPERSQVPSVPERRCLGPLCSSVPVFPTSPSPAVKLKPMSEVGLPGRDAWGAHTYGGSGWLLQSESVDSVRVHSIFRPPRNA
jgi:hypothetical protein